MKPDTAEAAKDDSVLFAVPEAVRVSVTWLIQ